MTDNDTTDCFGTRFIKCGCKLINKIPGVTFLKKTIDKGVGIVPSLFNIPNKEDLKAVSDKMDALVSRVEKLK